jgi:hypothetical protein
VFPEEVHLPRQQSWVGILILINTLSEGSTAKETKQEGALGSNLVFFMDKHFQLKFPLGNDEALASTIQQSSQRRGKGSTKRKDPSQSQKGLMKATLCFVWTNI